MKIYDNVELNTELDELAEKGIHKGCGGVIFDFKTDDCFVYFRNDDNWGDYACAYVNKKYLNVYRKSTDEQIKNWEKFKAANELKTSFKQVKNLWELDYVRLIAERDEYAKEGAHKGMYGTIEENKAIGGRWSVMFEDENYCDSIIVSVRDEDLELVKHRIDNPR